MGPNRRSEINLCVRGKEEATKKHRIRDTRMQLHDDREGIGFPRAETERERERGGGGGGKA